MAKELTIQELIVQQKEQSKIKVEKKEKAKKAKKAKKRLEKKLEAERKAAIEAKQEELVEARNRIFKKCCDILKKCVGLEVSKQHKNKYMSRCSFEGIVEFSRKSAKDGHYTASLKVGKKDIVLLDVSYRNGFVSISLKRYSPYNDYNYGDHLVELFNHNHVNGSNEESICSKIQKKIVKYLSGISVDNENDRERIKQETEKTAQVKKNIVNKKKVDKNSIPVEDVFKFIDVK